MKKMNPVIHFEMPAKDKKRVAQFYTNAFGWNMQQLGEEMGNYILAGTTETDENHMVKTPGTINGGFFDYKDEPGFQYPSVVISVDNLQESMEIVKKEGGEVLGEPMQIPGIGLFVSIKDTEDNRVGMLQPAQM
ncbi:MAG TPA: VOC family protein [Candidatus Nitrosocosmicus sp.]|nr:VOC family protein [Candidatus Nitrosocosmicus sp.]